MGKAIAVFPLTLTQPSDTPISIDYTTKDGTAVAGVDYDQTSGTVIFAPGSMKQSISVPVRGVKGALGDKTFTVELSNPVNVEIDTKSATGTIMQNTTTLEALTSMRDGLWQFLQRATGDAATAAAIPPLITKEGLVRNNQFVGGALGGYTPDGACSSEGISLMLRGVLAAYQADGDAAKLAYAKFLFSAMCQYFFYGVTPGANALPLWYHSWLVNGGPAFAVRGPIPASGDLAQTGIIGEAVTFSSGVGTLSQPPDIIFQAVTNGTKFVWNNVFSDIATDANTGKPTGSNVGVTYYISSASAKVYGTQKAGSFGQPIEPNSTEPKGKIVLADTSFNGTLLINYCISVPDNKVQYGETYEAWPMWRHLYAAERTIAADALHWITDCIRRFKQVEPDNALWANALNRSLDVWKETCTQESDGLFIFKGGKSGLYNNYPLTYSYAYGVASDGTTQWNVVPPTDKFTVSRTDDGYVTFVLPQATGTTMDLRYGLAFECQGLYLSFDQNSKLSLDVTATLDAVDFDQQGNEIIQKLGLIPDIFVTLSFRPLNKDGSVSSVSYMYNCTVGPTNIGSKGLGIKEIPLSSFLHFPDFSWTSTSSKFFIGDLYSANHVTDTLPGGIVFDVLEIPLHYNKNTNGFGVDRTNIYPFAEWTEPPGIMIKVPTDQYKSYLTFVYAFKDAKGWQWYHLISASDSEDKAQGIYPISGKWGFIKPDASEFTLNPDVVGQGVKPSKPYLGVDQFVQAVSIQSVPTTYFSGKHGKHEHYEDFLGKMLIAYISPEQPKTPFDDGVDNISLFTILTTDTRQITLKVGDVVLEGGTRKPIKYYGTLPFGLQINGPSRNSLSSVPYRGPYIAGYQSGTPWVDLGADDKLSNMMDFMLDAQAQFTARHPAKLTGPFMHCYLPATWDSVQTGTVDTWVFDAPDGNPAWSGWQYRAFDAMSLTWKLAIDSGLSSAAKAATVATSFLDWLHSWLTANPTVNYVPYDWGPPNWEQGQPFPADGYLDPHGTTQSPHDMALCLKGAVLCAVAGYDATKAQYVIARLITMLKTVQVKDDTGVNPMRGAFTLKPEDYDVYGFEQGEVLDGLAQALIYTQFLPIELG